MKDRRGRNRARLWVDLIRRALLAVLVLALGPLLTGCGGSQLSPAYVRAANAAVAGQAGAASGQTGVDPPPGAGPGSTGNVASGLRNPDPPAATDASTDASTGVGTGQGRGHGSADPATGTKTRHGGAVGAIPGGAGVSCAGFRNQTGVTDGTITIANVSDISGPVPGIFTSAQQAVKAYVAYFNATSSLCGRKLALLPLDSRTDSGGDQAAYLTACSDAFAAIGSMSAFDSGGAATAQRCGLPDLRSQAVSDERNACTTCFGAQATQLHAFQNAVPDFFVKHYRQASQHAAMIYVNAAASVDNARSMQVVEEKRGMHFVYSSSFDVAEFNYSPYVQRMKEAGVRWVQFVGSPDQAVRLAQAMQGASFKPEVFLLDPTAYDPAFVKSGGAAVEGAFVFVNFTPFEEAAGNREMQLYEAWLQQVAPGAVPSYFGVFAWSAARLFGEQAAVLGGHLDRARLVARIRGVRNWTDHGLHAPEAVGPKLNGNCWRFLRLVRGRWVAAGGRSYTCDGSTMSS